MKVGTESLASVFCYEVLYSNLITQHHRCCYWTKFFKIRQRHLLSSRQHLWTTIEWLNALWYGVNLLNRKAIGLRIKAWTKWRPKVVYWTILSQEIGTRKVGRRSWSWDRIPLPLIFPQDPFPSPTLIRTFAPLPPPPPSWELTSRKAPASPAGAIFRILSAVSRLNRKLFVNKSS